MCGDLSGGVDCGWCGGLKGCGCYQDSVLLFQVLIELIVCEVYVLEIVLVVDFVYKMLIKVFEVIKVMMKMGQMVMINQVLDQEMVMIIVEELGYCVVVVKLDDLEVLFVEGEIGIDVE